MNLISPGDSAADNEALQLAQSLKYSSAHCCRVAELRPGLFALYDYELNPTYVGEDWSEVLAHYRSRTIPEPVSAPRGRKSSGKISAADKAANTARLLALLGGAD